MKTSEEQLFSTITGKVPLTILTELIKSGELTIYNLNIRIHSIAQYRYALKKLKKYNIVTSRQKKRKCYYSLTNEYKAKIQPLLSCYLSFDRMNVLKILQNFEGWAFRGKSALLYYVPFLALVTSKHFISVRSIKEQEKLERLMPNVSSILDIKVQPTYFRKSTNYLCKIDNFPVLRPEIIFPNLLRSDDARVRLSAIFLLPHMKARVFNQKIQQDDQIFLTSVYLLSALKEYLQEEKSKRKDIFLRTWFYNYDQMDNHVNFERFLRIQRKNKHILKTRTNFFRNLKKEQKKQQNRYTRWDQAAELVPERLVSFKPKAIEELAAIET